MTDATTTDAMRRKLRTDGKTNVEAPEPGVITFNDRGKLASGTVDFISHEGWAVREADIVGSRVLRVRIHRDLTYDDTGRYAADRPRDPEVREP